MLSPPRERQERTTKTELNMLENSDIAQQVCAACVSWENNEDMFTFKSGGGVGQIKRWHNEENRKEK